MDISNTPKKAFGSGHDVNYGMIVVLATPETWLIDLTSEDRHGHVSLPHSSRSRKCRTCKRHGCPGHSNRALCNQPPTGN
jgi:hypothetical protein